MYRKKGMRLFGWEIQFFSHERILLASLTRSVIAVWLGLVVVKVGWQKFQ